MHRQFVFSVAGILCDHLYGLSVKNKKKKPQCNIFDLLKLDDILT